MRKILLITLIFLTQGFCYYEANDKTLRDGFEAGLKALEFQRKVDGVKPTIIKVNKPYLLVFNISNMPIHEALFLQTLAFKEGIDSHLTKESISFGEYEREIDAKDIAKLLSTKFKLNAKDFRILTRTREFITYPYLWSETYSQILNEARELGIIVETKILNKKPQKTKTQNKPKNIAVEIILKNPLAMAYTLKGDSGKSKDYKELGLMEQRGYLLESKVTTLSGEHFVKVKGENLYFSVSDVRLRNAKE
ncbi:hypothetical protein [Helicobacter turcicus]|uniref:Periplasmic protein n=1 Tax=Helicobacter turcicus TaxID=2867412 RepID=A0ABS7JPE2_9HELI|nr:hypothetical protein [Helicobacter turcicus]MBX7491239.1 hypothetical protein [Helicobacter turcicus]MBX7546122.1 hypothetical protein [Helicobacter turcicus]